MPYEIRDIVQKPSKQVALVPVKTESNSSMPLITSSLLQKKMKRIRDPKELKAFQLALAPHHVKHFRFIELPDIVRQTVRDAVMKDIKDGVFQSYATCADAYGISHPLVTAWKQDEEKGNHKIRSRGRPQGVLNGQGQGKQGITNVPIVKLDPKREVKVTLVRRYFTVS